MFTEVWHARTSDKQNNKTPTIEQQESKTATAAAAAVNFAVSCPLRWGICPINLVARWNDREESGGRAEALKDLNLKRCSHLQAGAS